MKQKLIAAAAVVALVGLIYGFSNEVDGLTNTLGARKLIIKSLFMGAALSLAALFFFKKQLSEMPEKLSAILLLMAMSLFLSAFFNRRFAGERHWEPFVFEREEARFAGFGLQKGEPIQPSHRLLFVKKEGQLVRFKYRKQAYFPLTKPGEDILLPMRRGGLGFEFLDME